jgi:hypothetical protein
MMFNSPLQFCPVIKEWVALDQTQHECALEYCCDVLLRCPLRTLFKNVESQAVQKVVEHA